MKRVYEHLVDVRSITPENPKGNKVVIDVEDGWVDNSEHIRLRAANLARVLEETIGE